MSIGSELSTNGTMSRNLPTGHVPVEAILKVYEAYQPISTWDRLQNNSQLGEICIVSQVQTIGEERPAHLFIFQEGYLLGKDGIVFTRDGIAAHETTNYSHLKELISEQAATSVPLGSAPFLAGEYLPLCGRWSNNFWHWMMDYLPKLILAELAGFRGRYILPAAPPSFVLESMDLLGVQTDRRVLWDQGCWRVERLFVPQQIVGGTTLRSYPTIIERLREMLLSKARGSTKIFPEKVYVSRCRPGQERAVVNEKVLLERLAKFDFIRVEMEQLSLAEQISLMSNARVLVGPHGAGFVHTLFMQPKSLVIELFSPSYVNACMLPVIEFLQHRYHMMISNYSSDETYPYGKNVVAHTDLIEITLKRELSLRAG